uniref:Uncharacterized protein n=1 Tax=Anguilla anguilla TaxID=7936 RepID=A0A0E9PKY7_ANGAN
MLYHHARSYYPISLGKAMLKFQNTPPHSKGLVSLRFYCFCISKSITGVKRCDPK